MKIHVISETPFVMKATGVHTAFLDHIELLKEKNDIEVVVNDEGKVTYFMVIPMDSIISGREENIKEEEYLLHMLYLIQ